MSWQQKAYRLRKEAQLLYFVFKHPRTRWYVKWVAACPVAYLFSPVQLIPNFIPVIGFLDDFLVLVVGAKLIRKVIPPDLLVECRALAEAEETGKREDDKSEMAWFGIAFTAATLLLVAVGGSAMVAALIGQSWRVVRH